jgi:hypothetical protein
MADHYNLTWTHLLPAYMADWILLSQVTSKYMHTHEPCLETARTVLADVGPVVLVDVLHVLEVQVRGGEVGRAVLAFGAR